jgi:serine/threonine protein kinase
MNQFYQIQPLDSPSNGDNELFLAKSKENDQTVVIKKCDKEKSQTDTEFYLMTQLKHKHIISCLDIFSDENFSYIVMEYAPNGNLYKKNFTSNEVRRIIFQLVSAIRYCHRKKIIHRDIKPENIVLFGDGTIKLIDFGWSCIYDENNPPDEKSGTTIYNPPEMLRGETYDYSVDVWQIGVLLYELSSHKLPFDGGSERSTKDKILRCKPRYPKYFSDPLVELLKSILTPDPSKRISLDDITSHEWFYLDDDY